MNRIKTINNGGCGVVSLYETQGTYVAVKQMLKGWTERNWNLFKREIDLMRSLNHPNIVSVRKFSKDPNNPYYIMNYYQDGSLRDKLNKLRKDGKVLPEKSACAITLVIANALSYAHSRNAVHRDIKPENILFDKNVPLVADWGIGKFIHKESKLYNHQYGTQPYCAPEQWHYGKSDHRSDIFSLGIMFRELLTGRVDGEIKNYRLKQIVDDMTSNHPDYRYQSMHEVAIELENLHTYSEDPVDDFWNGFTGKVIKVAGIGLAAFLIYKLIEAIVED